MKHRTWGLALPLLGLVLVATACAQSGAGGEGSDRIRHPTGSNDLVLAVQTAGGLVAPTFALSQVREFSLYGDGRVITTGPQIQIYPGPALPNLRVTKVSENGVQAILQPARAAGLFGPDRNYLYRAIADAPTTTFTLVADGHRHVISAYALGMDAGQLNGQMLEQERRARATLLNFSTKLSSLLSWLPKGSVGQDRPFVPTGLRVFVSSGPPAHEPGLKERVIDWTLAIPLAAFGAPSPTWPDLRCGAIRGVELAKLLPLARQANELSPWRSGHSIYSLTFRPLLPDESGCPK